MNPLLKSSLFFGFLGIDNIILSLDSKMDTSIRVASGVVLAFKLTVLILAIYFLTAKTPEHVKCSCSVESCETIWNSKEFRTWYESQYQSKPTTKKQFVVACKEYGKYVESRKKQKRGITLLMLAFVGLFWFGGIVFQSMYNRRAR
jgi:hypothetical protein